MTDMPRLRTLPLSVSLVALSACGPSLDEARGAWLRTQPEAYVFEYQRTCTCPGSEAWWRVTVRHDSVVNVQLLNWSMAAGYPDASPGMSHPTLSQMFDGIAAFSRGPHTWTRVAYDRQWHFPNEASGDVTDRRDSHWHFTVRNFRPL